MAFPRLLAATMVALAAAAGAGCGDGGSRGGSDAGTDTDAGTDADSDSDSDATDAGTDAGTDTGTDTDCAWSFAVAQASATALFDIHGAGEDEILAVGGASFFFDGSAWSEVSLPYEVGLYGVWYLGGAGDTRAVAVGIHGDTLRFDGTAWNDEPGNSCEHDLYGVYAANPTTWYAVSGWLLDGIFPQGELLAWNDALGDWDAPLAITEEELRGIWGWSAGELKVVGGGGVIAGWYGSLSMETIPGLTDHLLSVHGCSPTDIWAVGSSGKVVHSTDGSSWSEVVAPTTSSLLDVWCFASDAVFVGSVDGALLIYDGVEWQLLDTGYPEPVRGVYAASDTQVYLVTDSGASSKIISGTCE